MKSCVERRNQSWKLEWMKLSTSSESSAARIQPTLLDKTEVSRKDPGGSTVDSPTFEVTTDRITENTDPISVTTDQTLGTTTDLADQQIDLIAVAGFATGAIDLAISLDFAQRIL